jgi:polyferredoxin
MRLQQEHRVRILSAVATRGARYQLLRILVITLSLLMLLAVPLLELVRVDLWGGAHLLLGEPVGLVDALGGFVVAMAVLWGVTFATNIVVGRFFCGWGCPVGYVSRLGEDVRRTRRHRGRWLLSHLAGAGFVATFITSIMAWWVDPRVLIDGSPTARAITVGIWLLLCGGGFLHAFVWRFGFCLSACPIGLYYRYVTSSTPVGIVFDEHPSPCIECGACEKICPVLIDPKSLGQPLPAVDEARATEPTCGPSAELFHGTRSSGDDGMHDDPTDERYGDAECIRCGDCVEACEMVFKGRPGETPPLRFGRVHRD